MVQERTRKASGLLVFSGRGFEFKKMDWKCFPVINVALVRPLQQYFVVLISLLKQDMLAFSEVQWEFT